MQNPESSLRLALPKGRMYEGIVRLLADAGAQVRASVRGYRPRISLEGVECKLLKTQNAVEMLAVGSRDIGFAGADWVAELGAEVVQLLDTELDPVRIVLAAPRALVEQGWPPQRTLVVASEYERLTRAWVAARGMNVRFVRSYGATEVFPPEDADCIVDNTATGETLAANGLTIVDELQRSSTRLYAHPGALEDPVRRRRIDDLVLLLRSVLEARRRVMVEVNIAADRLDAMAAALPCMREPTIAPLRGNGGYAVRVAVPRTELAELLPRVRELGGTDIVVTSLSQILP